MISKELLSKVLGINVHKVEQIDTSTIYYEWDYLSYEINGTDINIYELAHKCKEWAYDNNWFIYERKTPIGTYEYSALNRDGRISPSYNDLYILCQWILDNE